MTRLRDWASAASERRHDREWVRYGRLTSIARGRFGEPPLPNIAAGESKGRRAVVSRCFGRPAFGSAPARQTARRAPGFGWQADRLPYNLHMQRSDGRAPNQLRPVAFELNIAPYAS